MVFLLKCWNGVGRNGVTEEFCCCCSCLDNGRAHGLGWSVGRSGQVRVRLTSGWAGEKQDLSCRAQKDGLRDCALDGARVRYHIPLGTGGSAPARNPQLRTDYIFVFLCVFPFLSAFFSRRRDMGAFFIYTPFNLSLLLRRVSLEATCRLTQAVQTRGGEYVGS